MSRVRRGRGSVVHEAVLSTPYVDARAADLTWSLRSAGPAADAGRGAADPMALPALAVLPVRRGTLALELHLLGASHRALLTVPTAAGTALVSEAETLVEIVACRPGARGPLPPTAERRVGALRYSFSSAVSRHGADFPDVVAGVVDGLPVEALVGRFPGEPHALTALSAPDAGTDRLVWHTWHVYPQTHEIVETRSEVQLG